MSKAEPVIGVAQHKWISRQCDDRHLSSANARNAPYPEIFSKLLVQVLVMIFGKIVNPTSKQSDDAINGARCYLYTSSLRTTIVSRFSDPFGRLLAFYDGQLNSLSVLKSNFAERLKDAVFVKSFNGLRHGEPRSIGHFA